MEELKEILKLLEDYKNEAKELGVKKEGFSSINKHLNLAIEESKNAVDLLIKNINLSVETLQKTLELTKKLDGSTDKQIIKEIEDNISRVINLLTDSLTALEFQDILAQRLKKSIDFIQDVERTILKILLILGINEEEFKDKQNEFKEKLEQLEWKKEVTQDDVDEILKEFGL